MIITEKERIGEQLWNMGETAEARTMQHPYTGIMMAI